MSGLPLHLVGETVDVMIPGEAIGYDPDTGRPEWVEPDTIRTGRVDEVCYLCGMPRLRLIDTDGDPFYAWHAHLIPSQS